MKEKNKNIQIVLADPQGSSLRNRVEYGICYCHQQSERTIMKHRYDSIVEGIGLDRITANFDTAFIDAAITVSDQEALDMANWLLRNEGLFLGSSSAVNVVAACKTAAKLGNNSNIVTIACDGGHRHISRFWNPDYIKKYDLNWPAEECIPECLKIKV